MHLDPDFEHLTYGDQGTRAHQLRTNLQVGDFILFYASLIDTRLTGILIYALIGLFIIEEFLAAADVPPSQRDLNAHSRRVLQTNATDLIVCGRQASSGRFKQCLPIGEYRDGAYRVRHDLLGAWGGLSVKNGYIQRSARLPRLLDPSRFLQWLELQKPTLLQVNN